ncbi:MAG: ammonium transporter [Acidimicrobiales bacterium]|nr:ammonium transporter [Acidimicrobiales bacterium]
MHDRSPSTARHRWRPTKLFVGAGIAGAALVAFATPALAQDDDPAALVQATLDNVWILVCAVLVIFMQAGFALVEAGLTRAKSVANIMMKNLIDFCAGAIAFYAVGFAIAYGGTYDGNGKFFGADGFFLSDGANSYGTLELSVFFMFQVAFAATAATIVSGAMAERTKFKAYLVYSFIISLIIYPVVVRWVWGGGWLLQGEFIPTPYHDFAGSSIVHMVGGITAFWGAKALGPRIGKYGPDGKPRAILGHSVPYAILGCFILLVGWYGFNPGSELAADSAIGPIALTTTLAAAAGALSAMATVWIRTGKPDVGMTGNGLLAGLVAITAGTAAVTGPYAILIGALAGILVVLAVEFVEKVLRVDDPVGAVAVHAFCGAFGTICVGLFASQDTDFWKQGLFLGGGTDQLVAQVVGVLAIAVWTSVAAIICFALIRFTVGLRVSEEEELQGLDVLEHGSPGYGEGFGSFGVEMSNGSAPVAPAPAVPSSVGLP